MKNIIKYVDPTMATEDEKEILENIEKAKKSEQLKSFMLSIKSLTQTESNIISYAQRLKRPESLLRTIRIKGKDNARDFVGMLFIVENKNDIYAIVEKIRGKIENAEYFDLIGDLGKPPHKTVPLSYTILTNSYLKDVGVEVPIEIRIHDKEGIIATESAHCLYKNDNISNVEERLRLSGKMLELFKMRCSIDFSNSLNLKDKTKTEEEMRKIVIENEEFFAEHSEEIYCAWREYVKNVVKFNNRIKIGQFEFINGNSLPNETVDKLDEVLDRLFDDYYQSEGYGSNDSKAMNMFNRSIKVIEKISVLNLNRCNTFYKGIMER